MAGQLGIERAPNFPSAGDQGKWWYYAACVEHGWQSEWQLALMSVRHDADDHGKRHGCTPAVLRAPNDGRHVPRRPDLPRVRKPRGAEVTYHAYCPFCGWGRRRSRNVGRHEIWAADHRDATGHAAQVIRTSTMNDDHVEHLVVMQLSGADQLAMF